MRPQTGIAVMEDFVRLAGPPDVVAWGTVDGLPWSLQAYVTEPDGEWWDAFCRVGPFLHLALGHPPDDVGAGDHHALIEEGHHFSATGVFVGRWPDLVAWVGAVTDDVRQIRVRSPRGTHPVELLEAPPGFPRAFVVFLPRRADAVLAAMDAAGDVVEESPLRQFPWIPPDSSFHDSVNEVPWIDGVPPPGWPPETRTFGPGEGPRWREDYYLHVAHFPLYVLPPAAWRGAVRPSNSSDSGGRLGSIFFRYVESETGPPRGLHVGTWSPARERPEVEPWSALARGPKDPWQSDFRGFVLLEAAGGFGPGWTTRLAEGSFPPWGYLGALDVEVLGRRATAERWGFQDYPDLLILRLDLPGALASVASNLPVEEIIEFVARLEPMGLDSDVFHQMKRALPPPTGVGPAAFADST
jgi:hypothetical protein